VKAVERPAYEPTWFTDTMLPVSERPPLSGDLDVEVCVVGAGLAGLTTALELARRGWSVAVVEARRIAWNASGRNTGFVLPGFAQSIDAIVRRVGLDHAKALWALSEEGLEYVRTTIDETRMPSVAKVEQGWLRVAKYDDAQDDLALVRLIGEDIGAAVEGVPTRRVREHLKSESYFHAIYFPNAFHIHPLNYAHGLAAAAEAAGVRICEGTPVTAIDAQGVRKRVTTPNGYLRASHIVLAGNVHLGAVMPRETGTLLPIWTYVATTAPLADLSSVIDFEGAVSDGDYADSHYRTVGGDRLMWAGGMTTWESSPRRYARRFKADIERIYPQLRPVEIEHVWTGVLGNPLHRMPQIGELFPRVWLASGFGGHGLNTTAMAGIIIARAIHEGDDTWRLFAPFELVWAGGQIGKAAAQMNYWWRHYREESTARSARLRASDRREREARPRRDDETAATHQEITKVAEVTTEADITQVGEQETREDITEIAPNAEIAETADITEFNSAQAEAETRADAQTAGGAETSFPDPEQAPEQDEDQARRSPPSRIANVDW
jgi:glycine/D-amino acid oxidase-like deaminating enzyme